tara:strand:- start:1350 stop:1568 length:219 start_codon:yes stop_codon:yes gene_type:complete
MKKLVVVITLLLASGCVATEQEPKKGIEFKSICGASSTLVCMPQYKECWCEDTDRLQRDFENLLGGGGYHYG